MEIKPGRPPEAVRTALRILNLLGRHFAHGLANKDIAATLGLDPSMVTRHVAALEAEGFAERIAETGRVRPSVRFGQMAVDILKDLDSATNRYQELNRRIQRN